MISWELLSSLGVAAVGVLAFLRVAANEIELKVREIEYQRSLEAPRKSPDEAGEVEEVRAAA